MQTNLSQGNGTVMIYLSVVVLTFHSLSSHNLHLASFFLDPDWWPDHLLHLSRILKEPSGSPFKFYMDFYLMLLFYHFIDWYNFHRILYCVFGIWWLHFGF